MNALKGYSKMKSVLRTIIVSGFHTVTLAAFAFAGRGDKAGTAAASELLIPVGAQSVALGGSEMASVSGIEVIYWNPAGLARSEKGANAMFSHMSYIADIGVEYFAVSST